MEIIITKFIEGGVKHFDQGLNMRLLCETNDNKKIVFWGSLEAGTRNIDSIKEQRLPCVVEIDLQDSIPSEYLKTKWGVSYSVSEHSWIHINPEV